MREAPTVGLGNAPTAQAAPPTVNVGSPNVSTNDDVKVTVLLDGAAIAARIEKLIALTSRVGNSSYDHDGRPVHRLERHIAPWKKPTIEDGGHARPRRGTSGAASRRAHPSHRWLVAMVGRMRLVSDRAVVDAAVRVEDTLAETYLGPNRTLREAMEYAHKSGMNFLTEFGEAARKDLAARATAVR